jgi:hypothetical protein
MEKGRKTAYEVLRKVLFSLIILMEIIGKTLSLQYEIEDKAHSCHRYFAIDRHLCLSGLLAG